MKSRDKKRIRKMWRVVRGRLREFVMNVKHV